MYYTWEKVTAREGKSQQDDVDVQIIFFFLINTPSYLRVMQRFDLC